MKKYLVKIKQVTIACALSMIIYLSTYWITSALMNEASEPLYLFALAMYSLAMMTAFDLVLIFITFVRKGSGEDKAVQDFQNGYWGFKTDIVFLFKQELSTFIAFAIRGGAIFAFLASDDTFTAKSPN